MKPDYRQLLKVLKKEVPDRPVLFEFFLNDALYERLNNGEAPVKNDGHDLMRRNIYAFKNAGYDYCTLHGSGFYFPQNSKDRMSTISLNDANTIVDWETYEKYEWPNVESFDNETTMQKAEEVLPEGMGLIVFGPGGVLENVIGLVGYDNLCMMLYDEPELAQLIFDGVGSRLVKYYEQFIERESVPCIISNDDWGFKTQTMLSPADMRKYVFPWHKKIVEVAHKHNKPIFLHSCGQADKIMEDIISDMKYDGKHSYEDAITPVEDCYETYKGRIAIMGGMDLHFLCTAKAEEITARANAMLERSAKIGGYALGSGNSVPDYIPQSAFFAMISAAHMKRS
ncbi:MAG: hypothetical protein FWC71_03455 [Defluviitaleaceae bacterium]|nr:hypothetical protein [Defluviitaleaceae bacterium]